MCDMDEVNMQQNNEQTGERNRTLTVMNGNRRYCDFVFLESFDSDSFKSTSDDAYCRSCAFSAFGTG